MTTIADENRYDSLPARVTRVAPAQDMKAVLRSEAGGWLRQVRYTREHLPSRQAEVARNFKRAWNLYRRAMNRR